MTSHQSDEAKIVALFEKNKPTKIIKEVPSGYTLRILSFFCLKANHQKRWDAKLQGLQLFKLEPASQSAKGYESPEELGDANGR